MKLEMFYCRILLIMAFSLQVNSFTVCIEREGRKYEQNGIAFTFKTF